MLRCTVFAAIAGAAVSGAAWGQCQEEWSDVFVPAFMQGGYEASATLFDDGSGMKLVVSDLRRSGDPAAGLQVWNGSAWATLSDGQFDLSDVQVIGADNGGASPRLFAVLGGGPIEEVVVLENGAWSGTSFPVEIGFQVAAGIVPDPSTDDVYMFGLFRNGGGYTKVYKWDGSIWTALDADNNGASVTSLEWFDDGSGMAMYAGVRTQIDGVPASGVARWDGEAWSEVGGGCPAYWPTLAEHDDGGGPVLWALDADGVLLAKWDGVSWTAYPLEPREVAYSWRLQSVTLGGQSELVWLDRLLEAAEIWRWDGGDGAPLTALAGGWANDVIEDESGALGGGLIAAGTFVQAGETAAACVAAFDGTEWAALGTEEIGNGVAGAVALMYVGDEGGPEIGRRVYVAASAAGGEPAYGVATWDGTQWGRIGPAWMESVSVNAFARGDLGDGVRVFAGGSIHQDAVGGRSVIAWDGQAWSVAAGGMQAGTIYAMTFGALAGSEAMLFVGGSFETIEGAEYHNVAAIDSDGWVHLGEGLPAQDDRADHVLAMAVHDDGAGAALYAGGRLDNQIPELANGVVRWDGSAWSRVGDALGGSNVEVAALCSADLGDGSKLYAGGWFDGLGGGTSNVAVWDGSAWEPLPAVVPGRVNSLAVIETSGGVRLAATSGEFTDGAPAERVFLSDGSSWSAFGAIADARVEGVAQAAHESGAVYLVGAFAEVSGVPSEGIARWGCEGCPGDFDGDGVVDTRDVIAFLNAWAAKDGSADLDGNGVVDTRDVIAFLNVWNEGC